MHFLKKIFSPTLLIFSCLLLIYTFYKSEIYYDGTKQAYFLVYYLLSSILILFSIITFFINQKIKEYLIISIISLLVGLYLFEGSLVFTEQLSIEQFSKTQLYKKKTGIKWDKRSRFEIYEDLKKINNEIVVSIYPNKYINNSTPIFALSGVSNSQTIYCNENGNYSIYQSDRYGFNNPDEEWDKKEIQYLLVGDSFVHGACVNRPHDISSVLRDLSNNSVLSLGMGGNGPLIEYAALREYLSTNVKKVLWFYYEGNDFKELLKEKENNILVNYLKDLNFTQNLKFKQDKIDDLGINYIREEKEKKKENGKLKLIEFIKMTNIRSLVHTDKTVTPAPVVTQELLTEFKKILQFSNEIVKKNNSKLYFIYLPEYSRYKNKYNLTNYNYNMVKNIMNELNITFIDIHKEVFEKEKNPLKLFPFEKNGHYNTEGYKKVAETIYTLSKD